MKKKTIKLVADIKPEDARHEVQRGCFSHFSPEAMVTGTYLQCSLNGKRIYHGGVVIRDQDKYHLFPLNELGCSFLSRDGYIVGPSIQVGQVERDGCRMIQTFDPIPLGQTEGMRDRAREEWKSLINLRVKGSK